MSIMYHDGNRHLQDRFDSRRLEQNNNSWLHGQRRMAFGALKNTKLMAERDKLKLCSCCHCRRTERT